MVHASGIEPVWLPAKISVSPLAEFPRIPASMEKEFPRVIQIPSGEEDSVGGLTTIPPDLIASLDDAAAGVVSEDIVQRRLEKMSRLEIESPQLLAALPPEEDHKPVGTIARDSGPGRQMERPHLLKKILPVYPRLAKTARIQGAVVLVATITESGTLEDVTVISGHPMLVEAALDAVRQWRYAPARIDGVAVRSSVDINVNFKLEFQ